MKTENHFFDNDAIRIIIAILTSGLGILLIQGTVEFFVFNETFVWCAIEDEYRYAFMIIGFPVMMLLLTICVKHKIGVCFLFSLFWAIGAVSIEFWYDICAYEIFSYGLFDVIEFAMVDGLAPALLDIDATILLRLIRKEKSKMRIKGKSLTGKKERLKSSVKGIIVVALIFLLSMVPPYIFYYLFTIFVDPFRNIGEWKIFCYALMFALILYILIFGVIFLINKKYRIFIWNYAYVLSEIWLMLEIVSAGPYVELSVLGWYIFFVSFKTIALAELLFTIYVNYLRSKRERF